MRVLISKVSENKIKFLVDTVDSDTVMYKNRKYRLVEKISDKEIIAEEVIDADTLGLCPDPTQIIVLQDLPENINKSGITVNIKEDDINRLPSTGIVVAVGDSCDNIVVGDRVFFSCYSGVNFKWKGLVLLSLRDTEIMGSITKDDYIVVGDTRQHELESENWYTDGE